MKTFTYILNQVMEKKSFSNLQEKMWSSQCSHWKNHTQINIQRDKKTLFYGGQWKLSTQLLKVSYLVIPPTDAAPQFLWKLAPFYTNRQKDTWTNSGWLDSKIMMLFIQTPHHYLSSRIYILHLRHRGGSRWAGSLLLKMFELEGLICELCRTADY